jgi:S-adenosylmethionine:diacylglycerol 3-amino-3-carboxypropyl transferase
VDGVLERVLVREHPWWRPLASGRPVDVGFGAPWVDGEGPGRRPVEWVHDDLTAALAAQAPGSLDAISVSNVPDWLDDAAEAELARAIAGAAAPGARVLVRHLVRPAGDDRYAAAGLVLDRSSDGLPARDRTALYESIDLYRVPNAQPTPAA